MRKFLYVVVGAVAGLGCLCCGGLFLFVVSSPSLPAAKQHVEFDGPKTDHNRNKPQTDREAVIRDKNHVAMQRLADEENKVKASMERSERRSDKNRRSREEDADGAKLAAETFTRRNLAHPSTSKFPWLGAEAKESDGKWTVTGTVKAKNSFNLETTLRYKCIVRKIGDERWECVECNVVESDD